MQFRSDVQFTSLQDERTDVAQALMRKLKEMMYHGLLSHGENALTLDILGRRHYCNLDQKGQITRKDHTAPFVSLDAVVFHVYSNEPNFEGTATFPSFGDHFSRISQLYATPHTPCNMLY